MTGSSEIKPTWDPWKLFNVSDKEMELAKKRHEMKMQRKAEFRRLVDNPYKGGRGGYILDPNMQRWYSSRSTLGTYFRPTKSNSLVFLFSTIIPMGLIAYFANKDHEERERKYRSGELKMNQRGMMKTLY